MKNAAAILSIIAALAASSSALAFRDEAQSALIARAMEAKRIEALAKAKEKQADVAAPTGAPERADPGTQMNRNRRDPTRHP